MCSKKQDFKSYNLKFSSSSTASHEIFIKEHSVRTFEENKPQGRTLFAINLPPYVTHKNLRNIFPNKSEVSSVIIESNGDLTGFKTGYVIFKSRDALLHFLKNDNLNPLSNEEFPVLTGMDKWIKQYNESVCDPLKLKKEVDEFMIKFDKEETKRKNKEKGLVDDDGWTVVTKKQRNPGLSRKESLEIRIQEKLDEGKKKKENDDFYAFQKREKKMVQIVKMREKFEEDKKKVIAMKSKRKFRPY